MAPVVVSPLEQEIRNLEQAVLRLRKAFEAQASGTTLDDRWLRLLTRVEDAGGRVSAQEWRRMGIESDYDPRGLGGFFSGNEPSMELDGDDRVITPHGVRYLEEYGRRR